MGLYFDVGDESILPNDPFGQIKILTRKRRFPGSFYRMSPKIREIGYGCFMDAEKLEKIVLSPNLQYIGVCAFCNCNKLKEVRIPEGVKKIDVEAFIYCSSLKEVSFPSTLKIICSNAFFGSAIEKIVLPDSLKELYVDAFSQTNATELTIPAKVQLKRIPNEEHKEKGDLGLLFEHIADSDHDFTINKLTITYENFAELYNFLKKNHVFNLEAPFYWHTRVHPMIILKGVELSKEEKKQIEALIDEGFKGSLVFNEEIQEKKIEIKEEKQEKETTKNEFNINDPEINNKVEEILKICEQLDSINRKIIIEKIKKLIEEYKTDLDSFKPKYGEEINLSQKSITTLKPTLLNNLDLIKLDLVREEKLIKKISDISKYKIYLNMDINELTKDDNTIETMIKNIVYYCKFLDDDKKKSYLDRLSQAITKTLERASTEFENILEDKIKLTYETDYELELMKEVDSIYDEVANTAEKRKPFIEVLNFLRGKEATEYKDKDDLISFLNNIEYVINKLSESKYQEELKNTFIAKKEQYIKLINEILNDKTKLRSTTIEDVEIEIRKDINPLLEKMNKYAYLDKHEGEYIKDSNLIEQLDNCEEIITNEIKTNLDNLEGRQDIVTICISEIINKLNEIDNQETKEEIKKELMIIVKKYKKYFTENKINDLKEYNKILLEIINEIAIVDFKVTNYIIDEEEYRNNTGRKRNNG